MAARSGESLAQWVERLAAQFAENGLPLIAGRILGHLLVCDPPERTAAELAAELEASTGSISTNLRLLGNAGVVTKTTRRGRQAALYRIDEHRWADFVRRRLEGMVTMREVTSSGLRLLSGHRERAERLRVVDELYGWLAGEVPQLWQRFASQRRLDERH